jgi:hypothetical protein
MDANGEHPFQDGHWRLHEKSVSGKSVSVPNNV